VEADREQEKYEFFIPGSVLYFAGIYHKTPAGGRFTILTRGTEGYMTGIHPRMPLILHKEDLQNWLFSQEKAEKLLEGHFTELQRQKSETDKYQQMTLFD